MHLESGVRGTDLYVHYLVAFHEIIKTKNLAFYPYSCFFHILSELESCSSQSFHSIVEYIYMTKRKVIDRYGLR